MLVSISPFLLNIIFWQIHLSEEYFSSRKIGAYNVFIVNNFCLIRESMSFFSPLKFRESLKLETLQYYIDRHWNKKVEILETNKVGEYRNSSRRFCVTIRCFCCILHDFNSDFRKYLLFSTLFWIKTNTLPPPPSKWV